MIEPIIICPNCKAEIKLTESLAAPLVEHARLEYEKKLAAKDREVAQKEAAIKQVEANVEATIAQQLASERQKIAEEEARRARQAMFDEISKEKQERAALEQTLKERSEKLAAAQKNEIELRQQRQKLQEEKEQFELDKQRAIDEERGKIREAAKRDADEQAHLKMAEREKTIADLQAKLQEALRKAEQGSQQLQGEVLELQLEETLRSQFPTDIIEPVPKGAFGGDIIHRVVNTLGRVCGTILWESKRTKNWSDGWLAKLRDDQRSAKADVALIITQVLPKGTTSFNLVDGVWVSEPRCAVPVAIALRQSLIELSRARQAAEGQQTKMELVYRYLTGPDFRHRVSAIVEKFSEMQEDLDKERKATIRLWAKREGQIRGVIEATAGMYGDLQGIAGKTLEEIDGLALPSPTGEPGDAAMTA